jgi:hypothetical protein
MIREFRPIKTTRNKNQLPYCWKRREVVERMPVFDNTLQYSSFLQLTRVKRRTLPRDRVSAHACTLRPSLMQTVLHTDLRFPLFTTAPAS